METGLRSLQGACAAVGLGIGSHTSAKAPFRNDWALAISVDEREGHPRATARLQFGGRNWVGVGP
jgi:hypothetical protein